MNKLKLKNLFTLDQFQLEGRSTRWEGGKCSPLHRAWMKGNHKNFTRMIDFHSGGDVVLPIVWLTSFFFFLPLFPPLPNFYLKSSPRNFIQPCMIHCRFFKVNLARVMKDRSGGMAPLLAAAAAASLGNGLKWKTWRKLLNQNVKHEFI